MISQQKRLALADRMQAFGLLESDIDEYFVRGSGHGGQKINKTNMCVHLIHRPSKIEVRCQESRSQADNRYFARALLLEKLQTIQLGKESEAQKKIFKLRKQKKRRSKKAKEKLVADKRNQSQKKANRRRPTLDQS